MSTARSGAACGLGRDALRRVCDAIGEASLDAWFGIRVPLVVASLSVLEALEYAEILEDLGLAGEADEVVEAVIATCRAVRASALSVTELAVA